MRVPTALGDPSGRGTSRAVLMVAHPGHELRVHHWLERERPIVCVLSDGSGSDGRSRLGSTRRVVERAGAAIGPIFGPLSDRRLYACLLEADWDPLFAVADELAALLTASGADTVVGDAAEGFNPGHDLCRMLIESACRRVAQAGGGPLADWEFPLDAEPAALRSPDSRVLTLAAAALERKLAAARDYPELAPEVAMAVERFGEERFAVEVLSPAPHGRDLEARVGERPAYERHGEQRVASRRYHDVLRFREHFQPFVAGLAARFEAT